MTDRAFRIYLIGAIAMCAGFALFAVYCLWQGDDPRWFHAFAFVVQSYLCRQNWRVYRRVTARLLG